VVRILSLYQNVAKTELLDYCVIKLGVARLSRIKAFLLVHPFLD
jgi:hypothetical protein